MTLPICLGDSTPLNATGGITYLWSPAAGLSDPNIANPIAFPTVTTTYTVSITGGSCSGGGTDMVVVTVNNSIIVNAGPDVNICLGDSTTLNATGATTYSWNPVTDLSDPNIANPIAFPSITTSYTVTGTGGSCVGTGTDVVVVTVSNIVANAGPDVSICDGDNTPLNASGGINYLWDPVTNLSDPTIANPIASPNITTDYIVTVDDGTCSSIDTVKVTVITISPVSFSADDTTNCVPLCVQFTNTTPNSLTCDWNFGDNTTSNNCNVSHCYNAPGTYSVTLIITDINGCKDTLSKINYLNVYPQAIASFTMQPTATTLQYPDINFMNLSANSSAWLWDFGDGSIFSTNQNPVHTYSDTGSFCIQLIASNINLCNDTTTGCVNIYPDNTFFIPNAFTPNGDGINDFFAAKGTNIKEYNMWIFDRWGEEIFAANNIMIGWNGNIKNGKNVAKQDVYVYKIIVVNYMNEEYTFMGRVSLIR